MGISQRWANLTNGKVLKYQYTKLVHQSRTLYSTVQKSSTVKSSMKWFFSWTTQLVILACCILFVIIIRKLDQLDYPPINVHLVLPPYPFDVSYHNTLIVDYILPEDIDSENDPTDSLKRRLIRAEKLYKRKVQLRLDWIASHYENDSYNVNPWDEENQVHFWNYFSPSFPCPHGIERVGRLGKGGKWICGMDLYESSPKPEECVLYSFGNVDNSVISDLLSRTECKILAFQFEYQPPSHPRVEIFKDVELSDRNRNVKNEKTLRTILNDNDHGWVDILVMDMEGNELKVLEEVVEDFEVAPFGQLLVKLHVPEEPQNNLAFYKFSRWFQRLEKKGLRPFHIEVDFESFIYAKKRKKPMVMEFSFFNLRGKHLLVKGK